ncbi:MAG: bifunctional folylpolyglutamate synthase/dihydrofolate synthase [Clostridia bacterium]|nr:bifunctional folylpolyglutamate synthase/dihydrofolate synthase [Clostridia bacterium]
MNYDEALNYIHSRLKFGIKLGLENMKNLLQLMDNPHRKLKYVHVAGTNGKGSTVSLISSILMEAGYKVGIYTSPYIERFTERMKINQSEISEDELSRITSLVKEKAEMMEERGLGNPTEFEIVTAVAFEYFSRNDCDVVVLEVGLGGRLDSTNIIDTPEVAVITTISYDHMDKLGNTLREIAFEKAGIIKEGGRVVLYPQPKEVEEVFFKVCKERNCCLHEVSFDTLYLSEYNEDGQCFDYGDYKGIKINLLGRHQAQNAALVLCVSQVLKERGFQITELSIREGLRKAVWPGRFEVLNKKPLVLIDGAHNEEGARVLAGNLNEYFPDKQRNFIIGVLKDKNFRTMMDQVLPGASTVIAVTPKSDRAMPGEDLADVIKYYCKNVVVSDTIDNAIEKGLKLTKEDGLLCAFGSLYYIGEVRKWFCENRMRQD